MKTISTRQFASIKRIAMNVNPLVIKKNKLISKINELTEEIAQLNDEIEGNEMGIKAITDGFGSEVLVIKKIVDSGKVDKNGNPIKITKYEPNPNRLQWDEEKKVYNLIPLEDDLQKAVNEAVAEATTELMNNFNNEGVDNSQIDE